MSNRLEVAARKQSADVQWTCGCVIIILNLNSATNDGKKEQGKEEARGGGRRFV
jgi:hypothetical protein